MAVRGIRGATTIEENAVALSDAAEVAAEAIHTATHELLLAICAANPSLRTADIASVFFTVTDDLSAAYPAKAARDLGWEDVPLMCAREIPVPGSLARCIRVMIHWNTDLAQRDVHHVYLHQAVQLRPDLAEAGAGAH